MKKTTLLVLAFGAFLASCSDNGKQVESSEAKEVETVQTETSVEYATIKEGSYIDWRASHLGGAEPRFGKMYLQSANIVTNNSNIGNATFTSLGTLLHFQALSGTKGLTCTCECPAVGFLASKIQANFPLYT